MAARRTTVDRVEIVVNQWSPRVQRDRLIGVLFEKGPDTLLDVLKDLPKVGYFRTPESLAYDLRYAQRTPLPDRGEGKMSIATKITADKKNNTVVLETGACSRCSSRTCGANADSSHAGGGTSTSTAAG